jgi:hypothetical protein
LLQGLACLDTAVGHCYADVMGDLCEKQGNKDLWEECVMSEPQDQAAAPLHWHVFRHKEDGGKQYMLPIYRTQGDAMAAVAALKVHDHRQYDVEKCQNPTCHA